MNLLTAPTNDLRYLFLNDTPLLDIRAPVEFKKGSFPTASNYPLLDTHEREEVGRCYKHHGQNAAIELGYQLVSGHLKEQRINAWCDFVVNNPSAHLYCWRGGIRSNLTQQVLKEAGFDVPLITGGYKALRRVLINELDDTALNTPMIIIGGKTGVAKTSLINELATGIDLEGLANHRGSSFGRRVIEPPCQVNFENLLAIDVLKARDKHPNVPLFFEDESRNVGPITIPLNVWQNMLGSKRVIVEMPLTFRVQRVIKEYVVDMAAEYLAVDSENGFERYRQNLLTSLKRIQKRLGGDRYSELDSILKTAIDEQERNGCLGVFEECVVLLLERYYDPMYEYQMQKKHTQVVFRGDYNEVLYWAKCKVNQGK